VAARTTCPVAGPGRKRSTAWIESPNKCMVAKGPITDTGTAGSSDSVDDQRMGLGQYAELTPEQEQRFANEAVVAGLASRAQAGEITDAFALLEMLSTDKIVDDPEDIEKYGEAGARLRTLYPIMNSPAPGMAFAYGFGFNGFREEFHDPWMTSRNQVGHFMSSVFLSNTPELADGVLAWIADPFGEDTLSSEDRAVKIIVGHEKYQDPAFFAAPLATLASGMNVGTFRHQYWSADGSDVEAFKRGYLDLIDIPYNSIGNSRQDLELSYAGYVLGKGVREGEISSRDDMAQYVGEHLVNAIVYERWRATR